MQNIADYQRHACVRDKSPVACQAPLFMEFPRQEYQSGLSFTSPGDLPDSRTEPRSPTLQADSLPSEPPGKRFLDSVLIQVITVLGGIPYAVSQVLVDYTFYKYQCVPVNPNFLIHPFHPPFCCGSYKFVFSVCEHVSLCTVPGYKSLDSTCK